MNHQEVACYFLGRLGEYLKTGNLLIWLSEILDNPDPVTDLEAAVKEVPFFRTKKWNNVFELGLFRIVNYVLVREFKPKVFLETGVLHGITTNYSLTALRKNNGGKLFSVDLPSYFETGPSNQDGFLDTLPPGKEPGWIVPQKNYPFWELIKGRSLEEIPKILKREGRLDFFLHDSEHTYQTMWGEFNLAWEALAPGGVFICDNIDTNSSFFDFSRKVGRAPLLLPEAIQEKKMQEVFRFGIIQK